MGICLTKEFNNKVDNIDDTMDIMEKAENIDTIQFTRYLYEKEEVKLSLMMCILNKKDEEAVFWAYELFYSGLSFELTELIWSIYYDFYAVLNPNFEKYLNTKLKNHLQWESLKLGEDKIIAMIINNFIIRPFSLDVFLLRIVLKNFAIDKSYISNYKSNSIYSLAKKEFIDLLDNENYMLLTSFILDDIEEKHLLNTLDTIVVYYIKKGLAIDSSKTQNEFKLLMNKNSRYVRVKILNKLIYFKALLINKKLGKNVYIHIDDADVVMYETIHSDLTENVDGRKATNLLAYKILPIAALYSIDKYNYLSLFKLKRDESDIKNAYFDNWLYHASFTPFWRERIKKYDGKIDMRNKKIIFKNDDDLEAFYAEFNYEPDEQKKEVQNKSIQEIESTRTWLSYYKENNKNSVIDFSESFLQELEKIEYFITD
jgi:hypothetical protein